MEEYEEPEPKGKLILKVGRLVMFNDLFESSVVAHGIRTM